MKLVLITRHNMLLPIATVGSDGLFMIILGVAETA